MVTAYVGSSALVRLTGRLDGEWSRHLADTLDELLRDGLRSVVLDMSQVDYVSTPGVQVLGQRYRDFSPLRGELRVASPSPAVLQALTDAGLLDQLLLLPGDARVAGGAGRPSAPSSRPASEFTGDAWHVPSATGPAGQYEISRRHVAGELACRVVGRPGRSRAATTRRTAGRCISPPRYSGSASAPSARRFDETRGRFGELIGVAARSPISRPMAPSRPTGAGTRADSAPAAVLGAGLVCEGSFSNLIRFRTQPGAASVSLAELAEVALATSGDDVAGIVAAAEAAELVTTVLRRSPASLSQPLGFEADEMREWLAFSPERTTGPAHGRSSPASWRGGRPSRSAGFLRPLSAISKLVGHFHAMAFPYRPVPQRTVSLRPLVEKLLETQPLRRVGHLVFDDRGPEGAGENALLRGLCWTGPITSVADAA